jgi:predicted nuclease with TOPRIM domain
LFAPQENKKKLDGLRGKLLWTEFSVLAKGAEAARAKLDEQKAQTKALKNEYNSKLGATKPLEGSVKEYEKAHREANEKAKKLDYERVRLGSTDLEKNQDAQEAM